ncbi:MAG: ABC transporter permease [Bacteroidia bacterium]|nr:ABC transporter permease [Bacteroidota bacterium]MCZ2130287.1 ABC transporter permease [Bacteroidia bacterium]
MNLSYFIARRLSSKNKNSFASRIMNIAIAGVALGFAVIVIAISAVNGFQKEIESKVKGFSGDIEIRRTGTTDNYDYPLFDDSVNLNRDIAKILGVRFVNRVAAKPAIIKANDEMLGIIYKGIDSTYHAEYFQKYIKQGRMPKERNDVLISQFMANKLGLKIGDKIRAYFIKQPVRAIAPTVCGIYQTGLEEQDKMLALGSMADIQRIFAESQNQISHLELFLQPDTDPEFVRTQLLNRLDYNLDVHLITELQPQIFQWLNYLDVNKYIILSLMIFVSGISLITALLILVIERTNMIGILKTLGTSNAEIKNIFLYKISYIAFIGILIGNVLGVGLCYLQSKTGFLKLNQETYYIDTVPIDINPAMILIVNLACFAVCFLALMIPVQMVSTISPAKSVRFE